MNNTYSSRSINREVGPVCSKCNNERLNSLERKLKKLILPMTYGDSVELSIANQKDIAAWITRIAMLCDYERPHSARLYFSPDDRKSFIETLDPFERCWVWIGKFRNDTLRTDSFCIHTENAEENRGMIVTTGIVGLLAFQFLSRRWNERPSDDQIYMMMYPIVREWSSVVFSIWPRPAKVMQWPPLSEDLTFENINAFAYRWGGKGLLFEE